MMRVRSLSGLIRTVAVVLLLAGSCSFAQTVEGLRYKVYYQCNGERVQVDHCRKDDDGKGYGPPTKPQENYCLVYYPDRPKRGGFTVQTAELYDEIVKKLQACGALAAQETRQTGSSGTAEIDYAQGHAYVEAKEYAKAVPFLQEAVRLKPDYGDAWVMLGTSYFVLKQYPDALAAFQRCDRLAPKDAGVQFLLGAAYVKVGNKDAAWEVYRRLQTLDLKQAQELYDVIAASPAAAPPAKAPANTGATTFAQQASTYYEAKDYPRAIEAAKKALASEPNNGEAYNILGVSYAATKRYPEAAIALQQAILLKPGEAQYQYNLGDSYFFAKDYAKAIAGYQAALTIKPAAKFSADAYHWIGLSYQSLKQFDQAAKALQQSLQIKPEDPTVLYQLGLAYLDGKHYPEAEAAFLHALRVKPDHALCNYFIGYIYNEQEQPAKAVPYLQAELRLNPKDVMSHRELGFAGLQLGKYADAVAELKLVVQAAPKDAYAQFLLGEAYVRAGNKSEAEQIVKTLKTLDKGKADDLEELIGVDAFLNSKPAASSSASKPAPAVPRPGGSVPLARQYIVMGTMTSSSGDPAKALGYYRRAIELSPDQDTRAMAYAYEGSAYDSLKQYDKAVTAYRESLKLNPGDNHTNYLLGWVYVEMGKKDEALKVCQALQAADKAEADHLYLKIQSTK